VKGTGAGQVTVNGTAFIPVWDLDGDQGWVSGTYERRLYEEGGGTLKLPNSSGPDGQRHLDRFLALTDDTFAPGDEWYEVYDGNHLMSVWTPVGTQRVGSSSIDLSGEDATTLLKRTRETDRGYWNHAPRDVIEHYGRVWRTLVADGFTDTGRFTYAAGTANTPDGLWSYVRCEDAPAPGAVRLRVGASQTATLQSLVTTETGQSSPIADRTKPWRLDVTFSRSGFYGTPPTLDTLTIGLAGATAPDSYVRVTITSVSTMIQVGPSTLDIALDTQQPGPWRLGLEGRDRWVWFTLDGKVVGVLPTRQDLSDRATTVRMDLTSEATAATRTVDVQSVTFRQGDRLLVKAGAGDVRVPGEPTPGGLNAEYSEWASEFSRYGWQLAFLRAFLPTRTLLAQRTDPVVDFATADPPA